MYGVRTCTLYIITIRMYMYMCSSAIYMYMYYVALPCMQGAAPQFRTLARTLHCTCIIYTGSKTEVLAKQMLAKQKVGTAVFYCEAFCNVQVAVPIMIHVVANNAGQF